MTDIEQYVADLEAHEGLPADEHGAYGYLDSRQVDGKPDPRVTFGIGNMVSTPQAMQEHPWMDMRGPQDDWDLSRLRYIGFEDLHLAGQTIPARKASYYQHKTTLRLPVEYCRQLCRDRLTREFLPALWASMDAPRGGFMGMVMGGGNVYNWPGLPAAARRVLVDCAWTTGGGGFEHEWPKLIAAYKRGDWDMATENVHSAGMGEERWHWRTRLLMSLSHHEVVA